MEFDDSSLKFQEQSRRGNLIVIYFGSEFLCGLKFEQLLKKGVFLSVHILFPPLHPPLLDYAQSTNQKLAISVAQHETRIFSKIFDLSCSYGRIQHFSGNYRRINHFKSTVFGFEWKGGIFQSDGLNLNRRFFFLQVESYDTELKFRQLLRILPYSSGIMGF